MNQPKNNNQNQPKRKGIVTTTTVSLPLNSTSARTERNRRRRQRRRQGGGNPQASRSLALTSRNRALIGSGRGRSVLQKLNEASMFMMYESLTMQSSVHNLLQNLYIPSHGLHRGIAFGSELTALTRYKWSQDISIPAGQQIMTFAFFPTNLTSATGFGAVTYGTPTVFPAGPITPFGTQPGGAIQQLIPGPFATTNPSTLTWRVVSFQLKLIPTATVTAKGGDLVVGYHPAVTAGVTGLVNEFNRANIDNLEWNLPVSGDVPVVLNWVPNSSENTLQASSHVSDTPSSCVLGYFVSPQIANTFRIEYDIGIEYVPNTAYRPYVERKVPQAHPDAWFYINKELSEDWERWIVMPYNLYLVDVKNFESLAPGLQTVARLNGMGSYGMGGIVGDIEAENSSGGILDGIKNGVKTLAGVYCSTIDPDNPLCHGRMPESAFEVLSDIRSGPRRLGIGNY